MGAKSHDLILVNDKGEETTDAPVHELILRAAGEHCVDDHSEIAEAAGLSATDYADLFGQPPVAFTLTKAHHRVIEHAPVDALSRFAKSDPMDLLWREVFASLTPLERTMKREYQRFLDHARREADTEEVQALLRAGQYDEAAALVLGERAGDISMFLALRVPLEAAALQFAVETASFIEANVDQFVGVTFDSLAPEVVAAIRAETMKSVTGIVDATRAGMRRAMEQAMQRGEHPYEFARTHFRDMIGLTERDVMASLRYRAELESRLAGGPVGRALSRRLRDARFDNTVRSGVLTPAKVDHLVSRYEARLLAHRANTIARTEAASALNLGQWTAWQRMAEQANVDARSIRRFWLVAPDEKTCEICLGIARMNPKGVGLREPFLTEAGDAIFIPPGHVDCRCVTTVRVDATHAARLFLEGEEYDDA